MTWELLVRSYRERANALQLKKDRPPAALALVRPV
jgi:hypothetical protein